MHPREANERQNMQRALVFRPARHRPASGDVGATIRKAKRTRCPARNSLSVVHVELNVESGRGENITGAAIRHPKHSTMFLSSLRFLCLGWHPCGKQQVARRVISSTGI